MTRRGDRLLETAPETSEFRDPQVTLDNFDFQLQQEDERSLVFDLATATFIARREDALFLGHPDQAKAICPGHRASRHRPGLSGDLP